MGKATTSDFVGTLYGSNFYKQFTYPMSKVDQFYMMEDNPHERFGIVKNWADSTDKTPGTMVYHDKESNEYYPFHDDYSYFGGDTFMEAILHKASDNPNKENTMIQGAFELRDNLEYWRMTQEFSYHPGLRRQVRLRRLGLIGGNKQADMAMSSIAMTPKDIQEEREEKRRAAQMKAAEKIMAAQKNID